MTPIYHITHINNLLRILHHGGLYSDSEMLSRNIESICIAYGTLKDRRAKTVVPVAAKGTLADYVPFYFCTRSPMLYAITCGAVKNYSGGQNEIIYIVSSVERVIDTGHLWCFTDGHAVEAINSFYKSLDNIDAIDWKVIESWSWGNRDNDFDRKRRKQAEFFVHKFFPWNLINNIGVRDNSIKDRVDNILAKKSNKPIVIIKPDWYY